MCIAPVILLTNDESSMQRRMTLFCKENQGCILEKLQMVNINWVDTNKSKGW